MLTIDSQIWIYYWDPNAKEHFNVIKWLNGDDQSPGVLSSETIVLSAIIPLEVAHNLFKMALVTKTLDTTQIEELLLSLISLENCQLIEVDQILIFDAIKHLKQYISKGIGGRDALILSTMERLQIQSVATHDKNLLSLKELHRIDPVFDPPLELEIGSEFDNEEFKQKISLL